MHLHPRYETLHDHELIIEKLPEEYGGKAGTLQQMTGKKIFFNKRNNF